jgi:peptide-methionine (S)-S-oxide reductase
MKAGRIMMSEVATLAGGCFWCMEAVFREVAGVQDAVPGYAGGATVNPGYEQVCSGRTGHAEAVQITFDPAIVSFGKILDVFFSVHDPTTPNRQGADVGTQYRSAIFYHSPVQKSVAEEFINEANRARKWDGPIITQLTAIDRFYPAEAYHRDYFAQHPEQAYCQVVIAPKMDKFRKAQITRDERK